MLPNVTDEKENEIVAIPKLLDVVDITGGLVSIDAIGCQTAIAEKIISRGANYLLAVNLFETIHHPLQPRSERG
jgi:predicted transposase YbfD/YdcC